VESNDGQKEKKWWEFGEVGQTKSDGRKREEFEEENMKNRG